MTYKQRLLKERAKVKEWIKRVADVEVQIDDLMSLLPRGKLDGWLITARDSLRVKRNELARSRVMRPITGTMRTLLRTISKCKTKDGWYWPTTSKDTAVRKEKRYRACEELRDLGFLKQKPSYLAYKISKKGLDYLKELEPSDQSDAYKISKKGLDYLKELEPSDQSDAYKISKKGLDYLKELEPSDQSDQSSLTTDWTWDDRCGPLVR